MNCAQKESLLLDYKESEMPNKKFGLNKESLNNPWAEIRK